MQPWLQDELPGENRNESADCACSTDLLIDRLSAYVDESRMMIFETSGSACPVCSRCSDIPTTIGPQEPGKASTCLYCGAYLIRDEDDALREMNNTEFIMLDKGVRAMLRRNRKAVREFWRRQPPDLHPPPIGHALH